jgi:nickel/cobalt exporter
MDLSLLYFPTAVALGGLHALEPGHAKTLTAAYLIGTKGTKRDAIVLGLSVAFTHSIIVIGLSVIAVMLGEKAFTDQASYFLAVSSSVIVMVLGSWLLSKRLRLLRKQKAMLHHLHPHDTHDHSLLSDDEHAKAHMATMPEYVKQGERPTLLQIITFGAAGGLIPCPASISVMLMALSLNKTGQGLILVLGFSAGLAITLVGIGLVIVAGISRLEQTGPLSKLSHYAPLISAGMVIFSGVMGLGVTLLKS